MKKQTTQTNTSKIIAGVDMGKKGVIAILRDGELTHFYPLPFIGKYIDSIKLLNIFLLHHIDYIAIEKPFILKAQSIKGNLTIGINYGKVVAISEIVAKTHPIIIQTWRAYFKLPKRKNKTKHIEVAKKESNFSPLLALKRDDYADAFLIAKYFYYFNLKETN